MTEKAFVSETSDSARIFGGAAERLGMRKYSAVQLLIALIALLVLVPFVESRRDGDLIITILLTAVLLSAVVVTGSRRRIRLIAGILVTPAVLLRWIAHYSPHAFPQSVVHAISAVFVGFVIVNLLRFVLQARVVNTEVLCAASSAYLLMGLLWMFAYMLAAQATANAFLFTNPSSSPHLLAGFEAMYFSFAALSTLNCNDIVPVSNGARLLAMTEAIAGVFFMTVLIARLVALYSSDARPREMP